MSTELKLTVAEYDTMVATGAFDGLTVEPGDDVSPMAKQNAVLRPAELFGRS